MEWYSGEILVHGAILTARFFEVSHVVIGLTIVAKDLTAQEVAASMIAAYRGQANFILGAILGQIYSTFRHHWNCININPNKSEGTLTN